MTDRERGLTPEEERRWHEAWEQATELDRRRYQRLHPMDRIHVLWMIPAGGASTLREATIRADGSFEEWRSRQD